ncbi:response regulator [Methylobacterium sp. BTF04]|uniref:response regulator n=1 Tax=Methylobacterium sp. BTF04 TaxID=2708300 RepID=UPI0013D72A6D|nr:response regulator [Methylobacterium sp. BTF04]NEU11889.1 response regulator [Methylobacterium sp. BTF04]
MGRISLKLLIAGQTGAAVILGSALVWGSVVWSGHARGAGPGSRDVTQASQAFAAALDRGLYDVTQDLRTVALSLRDAQSGLGGGDPQSTLRAWNDLRPDYADLLLVGANGRIKAAAQDGSQEGALGADVSGRPWFARARGAQSAIVTASATLGDPVPFDVAIPLSSGQGRQTGREDVLVARLSEGWLREIQDRLLRARPASEAALVFSVLGPDGRALSSVEGARELAPEASERGLARATPSAGYRDLAASGWLAVARAPDQRSGWVVLPGWRLGTLALALALAAAAGAYLLTGRLTRRLRRISEEGAPDAAPSRIAELTDHASRLVARERSRGRALHESRTALARIRERLRTFEAMSGWTYWEIDTGAGNVTWADSSGRPDASGADRAVALTDLTDGIDPKDRDLMQFTMQSALDGQGPHDVVLRMADSQAQQGERRLLVRFIRSDEDGQGGSATKLHALSRELVGQAVTDHSAQGGTDAATDEPAERRNGTILRQAVDGVVDDFNSLLTVVSANLATLKRRHRLSPQQSRLVDAALAGAQRGSSLTRRLVGFVRRDESTLLETDIEVALAAFVPFLGANILRQTSIETRVRPGLAKALCSEAMLEAVLLNLAFHVRDIGSEGFAIGADERMLSAEDGIALPEGRYIRIVLASGTPARVATATAPPGEGRSTEAVANLLTRIGGGFRLIADGRGDSAFLAELWIPAGDARAASQESEAASVQRTLRVLLVDSDTLVRESFAEALADLGHTVIQAGSAEHALILLDDPAGYDVMIADQKMPVMSGLQLAATVVQRHPALRIVLVSPQGQLPASARAFLRIDKPFRYTDLASVMREAAGERAAKAA